MRWVILALVAGLAFAACGTLKEAEIPPDRTPKLETQFVEPTQLPLDSTLSAEQPEPAALDPDMINRRVTEFDAYIPPRLIAQDGIRPIYEPEFVAAADAPLEDDELVIGIALGGEAKAYPITVLRFREMVNDELGGLPILVTW